MKNLQEYITEASKPVKEFEDALELKFPPKSKVVDGVLSFDMDKKKYKTSWNGWFLDVFVEVYNTQVGNVVSKSIKNDSEVDWDFNRDAPKTDDKWITMYTLTTPSGEIYEMVETQVRSHKTGKDHIYISIKKC